MHRRLWRALLPLITDLQQAGWAIGYAPQLVSHELGARFSTEARHSKWTLHQVDGDGSTEAWYGIDGLVHVWERECGTPRES